jgi:hypothetical protein
MMNNYEH